MLPLEEGDAAIVAAIARSAGFDAVNVRALSLMQRLLHQYMTQLTVRAQHYRLLCGRFELNIQDVESALFEFGVSMRELQRAYPDAESAALEVMPTPPIAEPFDERTLEALAALPVGQPVPTPSVIPAHLPPYTRAHTFRRSKTIPRMRTSAAALQALRCEQRRQAMTGLRKLLTTIREVETHS